MPSQGSHCSHFVVVFKGRSAIFQCERFHALTIVRLEWYDDMDCGCEDRYDLEDEPSVECIEVDPLGVLGMAVVRVSTLR